MRQDVIPYLSSFSVHCCCHSFSSSRIFSVSFLSELWLLALNFFQCKRNACVYAYVTMHITHTSNCVYVFVSLDILPRPMNLSFVKKLMQTVLELIFLHCVFASEFVCVAVCV